MTKQKRKRIQMYTSSLNSAPKIEADSYYKSDRNKRLTKVEPLDVKSDGVKFKQRMEQLDDFKERYLGLQSSLTSNIEVLQTLLIEFGYNTPNYDLNALIQDILQLNIIHPKKKYIGFKLKFGFIIGLGYDVIMEIPRDGLPEDIYAGYWYLNDSKELKTDDDKFNQIWGVIV